MTTHFRQKTRLWRDFLLKLNSLAGVSMVGGVGRFLKKCVARR